MVEPLFTKEHIDGMRPHIQQTVDSLLDIMVKEGCEKPVDIVEKFALPVPSYVSPLPQRVTNAEYEKRLYMGFLEFHSRI